MSETPYEAAARAIAVLLCDEGRNFDACTVCSCRAEAKACITAFLTAALADEDMVDRCCKVARTAGNRANVVKAVIKALANE